MSQTPLPGHADQPPEILCGSCGRFVGAQPKCPHCGANATARLSVRVFRIGAVLLATVGLGLLYQMAVHREIPLVEIGAISPTMNFAYVRVAGVVAGESRVSRENDRVRSVRFLVEDGSGEIPVVAYGAKGQQLADRDCVPHAGDHVEVVGSLNVAADRVALWLQSPDQLTLVRQEVPAVAIASLTAETVGTSAAIAGTITAVAAPAAGTKRPWRVRVQDASGTGDLIFWADTQAQLANPDRLRAGVAVRARVTVGSYRDQIQLRVEDARDLDLLDPAPAGTPPATPAGDAP